MIKDYLKRIYYSSQRFFFGIGKINKGNQGKINFIDVGSVGRFPQPWLSNSYKIKNALLFEPNESKKVKNNIIKIDVALWSNEEEKDFYIYKNSHGSSLFLQNYEFVERKFDELISKGNKKLNLSWKEWSDRFNEYIEYVEFLFSPNQIVFGGGISKYFNEFESNLKSKCEIIPAKNRNNAGIIGAATCFK